MSHSHTHGPGESHSHSHGPPQQQQQVQQIPEQDPAMLALIESDFKPVNIGLTGPDNSVATCGKHSLEKCDDCNVDFVNLNRMAKILVNNPNLRCPPPANIVSAPLSQAITKTKDEGNTFFKAGKHDKAINQYTMAASIAVQRPPWENNQIMREELSTVISNRSASYNEAHDYVSALTDANLVISLRRNWSKGHFRKAKALVGLGRLEEAKDALSLGLSFEPNNAELTAFYTDIEKMQESKKTEKAPIPVAASA